MLKLDPETHRHCAVAALEVLARELSEEGGSPGHLNRLRHLAMMAREHVADVFAETPRAASPQKVGGAPMSKQPTQPDGSAVVIPFPARRR